MGTCSLPMLIYVCRQSHSIELLSWSLIPNLLIFLNKISWSTVSNADFSSMYSDHNLSFFCLFKSLKHLIVSNNLSMFTSQPRPSLNPIQLLSSMNPSSFTSSYFNLRSNMVSINLYIGEVFVIGLVLSNDLQQLLSFGIYIYSRIFQL